MGVLPEFFFQQLPSFHSFRFLSTFLGPGPRNKKRIFSLFWGIYPIGEKKGSGFSVWKNGFSWESFGIQPTALVGVLNEISLLW
jgi:hypothetical protein